MGFVMGLPLDYGCNAVFICIDKLTKLVRLVPYTAGERELSAATIAGLLLHQIVCHFGVPE